MLSNKLSHNHELLFFYIHVKLEYSANFGKFENINFQFVKYTIFVKLKLLPNKKKLVKIYNLK